MILWSKPDVLRVPIGALFRGADGGWRVFALEQGRAREKTVRIGRINDEFGEVLAGLTKESTVVLNPGGSLEDGMRVTAR